jgi:hypothetical protein
VVPDDQVITIAVAQEVAVDDSGLQDLLIAAACLELLEDGHDLVFKQRIVLGIAQCTLLHLPLAAEEGDGVDVGVELVEVDVVDNA